MVNNEVEYLKFVEFIHRNAPIKKNIEILFKNISFKDKNFIELYSECLGQSGTDVGSWKAIKRTLRALNLAQYFEYSLSLEGERVECGVFKGFSALLMAQIQRLYDPSFSGQGFHLIDSFEGLSQPIPADSVGTDNTGNPVYSFQKGFFDVPLAHLKEVTKAFPDIQMHKGWIPEILNTLPERQWAFVHIDVDLYEPTIGCLEYFVPRMVRGGCIINDDFSSPLFPGGFTAWADYCKRHELSYAILDSGQSTLICE